MKVLPAKWESSYLYPGSDHVSRFVIKLVFPVSMGNYVIENARCVELLSRVQLCYVQCNAISPYWEKHYILANMEVECRYTEEITIVLPFFTSLYLAVLYCWVFLYRFFCISPIPRGQYARTCLKRADVDLKSGRSPSNQK